MPDSTDNPPLQFARLEDIDPDRFLPILNRAVNRTHLIPHAAFDSASVAQWVEGKLALNRQPGCKICAVLVGESLIGWCGIQPDDGGFELAIVIDQPYWGWGKRIFVELMHWAKALGHEEVCIHLLHTRPESKYLIKKAKRVVASTVLGEAFMTYVLAVG